MTRGHLAILARLPGGRPPARATIARLEAEDREITAARAALEQAMAAWEDAQARLEVLQREPV